MGNQLGTEFTVDIGGDKVNVSLDNSESTPVAPTVDSGVDNIEIIDDTATEPEPEPELVYVDLDDYTKTKVVEYIKSHRPKKLDVHDDFQSKIGGIDLVNKKLIPINIELYDKLKKVLDVYEPPTGKKYTKFVRYVRPGFGVDQIIKLNSTPKRNIPGNLNYGEVPAPHTPFNVSNITISEFDASFKTLEQKTDTLGISKKMLASLEKYHKQRLVACYNKLFNGIDDVNDISFGKTSFIYKEAKKGPKDQITSFRQIMAIPNAVSHFHRILALRLNEYLDKNNYVDKTIQKGGISGVNNGIIEQIYKVKETIKNATKFHKSACVMFMDISNAYGNLCVEKLAIVLKKYHIPQVFIDYITSYYSNFKYYAHSRQHDTDLLNWGDGLIQGCPLSAILFVLALNYVLKSIDAKYKATHGYTLDGAKIMLTGYIDDIAIICNSMAGLKTVFEELKTGMEELGLPLNMSKCGIMKIFPVDNAVIENIDIIDTYRYLGEYLTSDGKHVHSLKVFYKELGKRLFHIDKMRCDDDEKDTIFITTILPWLKRKMKIMYDLDEADRLNIIALVEKYIMKWGGNRTGYRLFSFILDVLAKSSDDVILNMKRVSKEDEELKANIKLANKIITDETVEVTYDEIKNAPIIGNL